jgi:hypothetical protein
MEYMHCKKLKKKKKKLNIAAFTVILNEFKDGQLEDECLRIKEKQEPYLTDNHIKNICTQLIEQAIERERERKVKMYS